MRYRLDRNILEYCISQYLETPGHLTKQDLTTVLKEFRELDDSRKLLLSLQLQTACSDYRSSGNQRRLSLSGHRRRLEQISTSSKNLAGLLRSFDLDAANLVGLRMLRELERQVIGSDQLPSREATDWSARADEILRKWQVFREVLEILSSEAGIATQSTERLISLPGNNTNKSRKSRERRYLWEPVFQLWVKTGHTVGFSPEGPLMRILKVVHAALSIAPPNPDAVRQAIREFKKGGVQQTKK